MIRLEGGYQFEHVMYDIWYQNTWCQNVMTSSQLIDTFFILNDCPIIPNSCTHISVLIFFKQTGMIYVIHLIYGRRVTVQSFSATYLMCMTTAI